MPAGDCSFFCFGENTVIDCALLHSTDYNAVNKLLYNTTMLNTVTSRQLAAIEFMFSFHSTILF